MQLRSGKSLIGVPSVKRSPVQKARELFGSSAPCFGITYPSLSKARELSISTNNHRDFQNFCYDLLHKCDGADKMTRRMYSLALVESFYQCGPDILKTYFQVMKIMYYKLKDAYAVDCEVIPPDMKVYLSQFLDLMIRVAPIGELDSLMYEKKISR
jgi:hypothetical protein